MSVYLLTCNITENTCSLQHYRKHVQDYTKHLQHYRKHVQHYMKHVQRYKKHLQHYTEHLQHYRKHVQHYKCQMKQKQCTNSVPIVKNSQTAKMSCLHRVRRIHKVRVRVRRPRPQNTQSLVYSRTFSVLLSEHIHRKRCHSYSYGGYIHLYRAMLWTARRIMPSKDTVCPSVLREIHLKRVTLRDT